MGLYPTPSILVKNKIHPAGLAILNDCALLDPSIVDPTAILVRSSKVNTSEYNGDLIAIARAGAGVDNIDGGKFQTATERGICVFNAPGANALSVAQMTMGAIMSNLRSIVAGSNAALDLAGKDPAESKEFVEKAKSAFTGAELQTKILGVIGLGYVGVELVNMATSLGMRVVGCDSHLTVQHALRLTNSPLFKLARSMDQVLREADIVSVHVPLCDNTRNLIGGKQVAQMKEGAIIVNYARGGIVDDDAVFAALDAGHLSAYLSDFASPKLVRKGVYATLHQGASTPESEERCATMVCQQLRDFLEYGRVVNSVNFPTVDMQLREGTRSRITILNRDIPGMIASYTSVLAREGINIPNVSGNTNGKVGYYVIDVPSEVPESILCAIRSIEGVIRARVLQYMDTEAS